MPKAVQTFAHSCIVYFCLCLLFYTLLRLVGSLVLMYTFFKNMQISFLVKS